VVGAGAVVTEDLPPYSIAIGSPAHVVRDRREAQEIRRRTAAEVHFGELNTFDRTVIWDSRRRVLASSAVFSAYKPSTPRSEEQHL